MPEKLKSGEVKSGEEEDVKQIAGAIGKALLNEVFIFIEKGKREYEDTYGIYFLGKKSFGSIQKEGDGYIILLPYDVLGEEDPKRALAEKDKALKSLLSNLFKSAAIKEILDSHLKEKGFEITRTEGGEYYLVIHVKKTESSG